MSHKLTTQERRSSSVTICLGYELKERIRVLAERDGVTVTAFCQNAIAALCPDVPAPEHRRVSQRPPINHRKLARQIVALLKAA